MFFCLRVYDEKLTSPILFGSFYYIQLAICIEKKRQLNEDSQDDYQDCIDTDNHASAQVVIILLFFLLLFLCVRVFECYLFLGINANLAEMQEDGQVVKNSTHVQEPKIDFDKKRDRWT